MSAVVRACVRMLGGKNQKQIFVWLSFSFCANAHARTFVLYFVHLQVIYFHLLHLKFCYFLKCGAVRFIFSFFFERKKQQQKHKTIV